MYKRACFVLASFFGAGYSKAASGTAGSAAALVPAFACAYFGGAAALAAAAAALYVLGVFAVAEVLRHSRHDPPFVVVDEAVGQMVALLPFAGVLRGNAGAWWICAAAFVLFRLFDITKPWPASYFDEKVISAGGVMLDDVVAGVYAAATLFFILAFV
ncbi:MAG: phosphatidylglycerophosphatase A [Rickettsiales bacterium]|jgi:phosphatidylglycerophosphatase A|nr:phosphatidylglycerophosphatase A [Rickettsiales bacterium]